MSEYEKIILDNEENLKKDFIGLKEYSGEFLFQMKENALITLRNYSIEKLMGLSSDNLLNDEDEKIYDYCRYVYENFVLAVDYYEKASHKIKSQHKKSVIEGIVGSLRKQVKALSLLLKDFDVNPILEEKALIIKKYVDEFTTVFDNNLDSYRELATVDISVIFKLENIPDEEKNQFLFNDVLDSMSNQTTKVCEEYLKQKTKCLLNLNDLRSRGITADFLTALKYAFDIISSIFKNQIQEVEAVTNNEKENDVVTEFSLILRDSYGYLKSKMNHLANFIANSPEKRDESEISTQFASEFKSYVLNLNGSDFEELKSFLNAFEEKSKYFKNLILDVAEQFVKEKLNNLYNSFIMEMRIVFEKNKQMTKELVKVIKVLIYYYTGNREKIEQNDELGIILGINETMQIKIDTIEEGFKEHLNNQKSIRGKLFSEEISFSESEKAGIVSSIHDVWTSNIEDFLENLIKALEDCEPLNAYIDKIDKDIIVQKERRIKLMDAYKKNNILNEIITIEEIGVYSVEKLKEYDNETINDYIRIFEKIITKLNALLETNGITRISPQLNDKFIAKEHEILVAEEREGFEKGAIIKKLNDGFKEDGIVIIRANVVVAK